jgi:heptosyltransferase II
MKILVRLPNWLGDMVMSTAFISQLRLSYPAAEIHVIVKKGLHPLADFFPGVNEKHVFSKANYPGLKGAYKFGKQLRSLHQYDLFFCLPDSFSSALMGYAAGAKKRVGYKNELRSLLLTHSYKKDAKLHRVDQYLELLHQFTGNLVSPQRVQLTVNDKSRSGIIINVNSEAASRRLPIEKAVSIVNHIRANTSEDITLAGGPADRSHVEAVFALLKDNSDIKNISGTTSLMDLPSLLASAKVMLTTDSGPGHVANAVGTPTVVLFGAGNEANTAPYNRSDLSIIRLGQLSCEPCVKNECLRFGIPKCLTQLDEQIITNELKKYLS